MTGAAVVTGTTAATLGTGGGHKLGSALETEGRDLLAYFPALTFRAFDLSLAVENDLLELFLAIFAMIFKNWHNLLLFLIISAPGGEDKREKKGEKKLQVRSYKLKVKNYMERDQGWGAQNPYQQKSSTSNL
jgi:hypothetical protein